MSLWQKAEELLRTHSSLVVFVLCVCLTTFGFGWTLAEEKFAPKAELEQKYEDLKTQITSVELKVQNVESGLTELQKQLRIDSLVQQIAAADSEIFSLQRLQENGEATSRDLTRLDMLISEKDEMTIRLNALYNQ